MYVRKLKRACTAVLGMAVLLGCGDVYLAGSGGGASAPAERGAQTASGAARELTDRLNDERRERGLRPLEWNARLERAARGHAEPMAERGELSHQFPGEAKMGERIRATGLRYTSAAENVAFGSTPEAVHKGLMNSPGHRANILNPKFTHVGIAVIERDGRFWAVQNFATVIAELNEREVEDQIAAAFNRAREGRNLSRLVQVNDPYLRRAACPGGPKLREAGSHVGAQQIVTYTISEPDKLPESMQRRASDASLRRFAVGACFAPSEKYGAGNFWVLVAFFTGDQSGR